MTVDATHFLWKKTFLYALEHSVYNMLGVLLSVCPGRRTKTHKHTYMTEYKNPLNSQHSL